MFENIAPYQGDLATQITAQIHEGTFSQVNLFGGPKYSLRMTSALEAARVLSCEKDGEQLCSCDSCRKYKLLSLPNMVIISQRDHQSVIETALSSYERLANDFSRNLLIRNIRIMLMQFHGSLLSSGQASNYNAASSLNETLIALSNSPQLEGKELKKTCTQIRGELKTLYTASKKNTTITISQVRALMEWINQTSMGNQKRFIIIEAMEQTNTAARNSLLKLLEEPPADTYFFLISEYPNRIMQTILSRVRRYVFPPLNQQMVQSFLQPYFLGSASYDSLENFYLSGGGMDLDQNQAVVDQIYASLASGRYIDSASLASLIGFIDEQNSYEYVLKSLLKRFSLELEGGGLEVGKAQAYSARISKSYSDAQLFNQSNKLMLEALYLALMEVS